jgi:hypothetical protein
MGYKIKSTIMLSIYLLTFQLLSGDQSADKIILKWENPETGTAVSYQNEKEYEQQPPVLFSQKESSSEVSVEINITPVLERLILPGSEDDADFVENNDDLGEKAASKAREFHDKKITTVNINGSVMNIEKDCSQFVRAAYWEASNHTIDLFRESISTGAVKPGKVTGVTLISEYFRKNHRYQPKNPKVGDIIVFDNTYDKNKNQKRDDILTHVGIVSTIRADNTIEFYHGNISRTIKKGYINFTYKNIPLKDNQPVNSYIRPRYSWEKNSSANLASYLVRSFAGY